jgi:serine/threonine protein phosphatase PrpC
VNEDRVHVDVPRGLFMVIDGVGGQAAGGKAADIALTMLRTRLERETGAVVDRVREAIAIANNEIHRAARSRPEWNGMACVLTVVVVNDGRAIAGHVGDTRLYKLRDGRIDKVTRDHSPVGEREDSMRSPSSRRCTIPGGTRSIATSVPTRTNPAIRASSTSTRFRSNQMPRCFCAAMASRT